jgi:hypothetical protein
MTIFYFYKLCNSKIMYIGFTKDLNKTREYHYKNCNDITSTKYNNKMYKLFREGDDNLQMEVLQTHDYDELNGAVKRQRLIASYEKIYAKQKFIGYDNPNRLKQKLKSKVIPKQTPYEKYKYYYYKYNKEYKKIWIQENQEHHNAYQKEYYKKWITKNPDYQKKWKSENPDYQKKWRTENYKKKKTQ